MELCMFVVVAIQAQQLPIATIVGIIVVIMIAVMHREFADIFRGEFARTAAANPRVHF